MGQILQKGRIQHKTQKHTIIADTAVILATCVVTVHDYFVYFHWNDQL